MPKPFCPSLGWVVAQESLNAVEALFGFAAICVMVIFPILGGIGSLIQKLFEKSTKQPPPYRTSPFSNPSLSAPNALAKKPETGFTTTSPSPSVPHRDEDPKILVARSLAAADTKPSPPGRCRKCGGSWARRVNHQTGGRFWGCSNYPRCTNTYDRQFSATDTRKRQASTLRSSATSGPQMSLQERRTQEKSEQERRSEIFWAQDHPNGLADRCAAGHKFDESNTYYRDRGHLIERNCRKCRARNR